MIVHNWANGAARAWRRVSGGERPLILMYHRIGNARSDPWRLSVAPKTFAAQLDVLKATRTVVPMSWLADRIASGTAPARHVAITFDDAYVDVLDNGVPALERAGLPATMFVPSDFIGRTDGFWWDALARVFLETADLPSQLEFDGQSIDVNPDTSSEARHDVFMRVWAAFQAMAAEPRQAAMTAVLGWAGLPHEAPAEDRCMDMDQLSAFHTPGELDLGAHTLSHPSLPMLDASGQAREIGASIEWLRERFGIWPIGFAYPYGDNDDVSRRAAQTHDAAYACTTVFRSLRRREDNFALPRLHVEDMPADAFEQMLSEHA